LQRATAWFAIVLSIFTPGMFPLMAGFAGTDLILPAVGHINGVGGSHFYTTVWITNPSSTEQADFEASPARRAEQSFAGHVP